MNFTNNLLDVSALPRHEEATITAIEAKYWKVIVINFLMSFIIYGLIVGVAFYFIEKLKPYLWYVLAAYILLMFLSFLLQRKSFKNRGYALRERDIIYRRGVLSVITTIIPFNRIQNVAINEGFLSRKYGLAQLHVFTAGGSSSDIKLSGLLKADAENMKEMILQQIVKKADDADIKITE